MTKSSLIPEAAFTAGAHIPGGLPNDQGVTRRLLIVDDDPADVFLARQALQTSGHPLEIDDVSDGVEALLYLRQSGPYADRPRPHFVLLDLNMPRRNGFETLREIRSDAQLKNLPVIVLTTSTDQADIDHVWNLQGTCYLSKQLELDAYTRQLHHVADFWCRTVCYPAG